AHLHDKARHFVRAIAGKYAVELAHKVEEGVKGLIVPSVIFEEFGLRYYGPIDGHDIPLLIRTFEFLKTQEEPVLLHILTQTGKGCNRSSRFTPPSSSAPMTWRSMTSPSKI